MLPVDGKLYGVLLSPPIKISANVSPAPVVKVILYLFGVVDTVITGLVVAEAQDTVLVWDSFKSYVPEEVANHTDAVYVVEEDTTVR